MYSTWVCISERELKDPVEEGKYSRWKIDQTPLVGVFAGGGRGGQETSLPRRQSLARASDPRLDLSERLGWDWGWAQKGSIKYLQWVGFRVDGTFGPPSLVDPI